MSLGAIWLWLLHRRKAGADAGQSAECQYTQAHVSRADTGRSQEQAGVHIVARDRSRLPPDFQDVWGRRA